MFINPINMLRIAAAPTPRPELSPRQIVVAVRQRVTIGAVPRVDGALK